MKPIESSPVWSIDPELTIVNGVPGYKAVNAKTQEVRFVKPIGGGCHVNISYTFYDWRYDNMWTETTEVDPCSNRRCPGWKQYGFKSDNDSYVKERYVYSDGMPEWKDYTIS